MTTDAIAEPLESRERPTRLRRRSDYVRASKFGSRYNTPLLSIQGVDQPHGQSLVAQAQPRFGFTVTKKVAGAVGRNRIRRSFSINEHGDRVRVLSRQELRWNF